jgi:hypothetical protein
MHIKPCTEDTRAKYALLILSLAKLRQHVLAFESVFEKDVENIQNASILKRKYIRSAATRVALSRRRPGAATD